MASKTQWYEKFSRPFMQELQPIFSRMEWKIAVKAGVAASLSLYFGVGFSKVMEHPSNLISGTWCVLSTFVVMQAHLGGTYRAAWVRFLGVMLGSFIGGLFTYLLGSSTFSLGISVIFTVLACSFFNLKDSIRIACLSVSIVNILWGLRPDVSPWTFAMFRFLDSALGILIAVIVAHTIWPSEAANKMRLHIVRTLDSIGRFYHNTLALHMEPDSQGKVNRQAVKEIWKLLKQDRNFIDESRLEMLTKTKSIEDWNQIIDHMAKVFQSVQKLTTLTKYKVTGTFDEKLMTCLKSLSEQTELAFQSISSQLESGESEKNLKDLSQAVENLNNELTRFRTKGTSKKQDFRNIETFFVFFYNLRFIAEELLQLQDEVNTLNETNEL